MGNRRHASADNVLAPTQSTKLTPREAPRTSDAGVDETRPIEMSRRTTWSELRSQTINTPEREADVARERALTDSQERREGEST